MENQRSRLSHWKSRLVIFFILLFTFFVFSPSLSNDFVNWDDPYHLVDNNLVRSLSLGNIKKIFTTTVNETYIPFTILSFAIEYHFFGFDPFAYHLLNLFLHVVVVGLIFLFALKVGMPLRIAGLAALLFGIHPMHVESVAWITQRKDVLYASFYLLSLISYWQYLEKKQRSAYLLSIILGLLSLLAKPMAMSLPLMFFVCDWLFYRRWSVKLFLEKIPHLLYAIPIVWITYSIHARVPGNSFLEAVTIWIWTFSFYIQKFFFPLNLSPLYQMSQSISMVHWPYLSSLIFFVLCVLLLIHFKKNRYLIFAFLFYFISIFFLLRYDLKEDLSIVADRYMYLPSLGFCFLFGFLGDCLLRWFDQKKVFVKAVPIFCLAGVFLVLSFKTFKQCQIWKDSSSLWGAVLSAASAQSNQYPSLSVAYNNRGLTYLNRNFPEVAINHFSKAIELNPHDWKAYNNRALAFKNKRQYEIAQNDFAKALEVLPGNVDVYNNRGKMYLDLQRYHLAMDDFNKAIEADPRNAVAYNNRGTVYVIEKQYDLALADFNKTLEVDPFFAKAYNNRANIYLIKGLYDLALLDYNKALELNSEYKDAYRNREIVYAMRGMDDSAKAK